MIHPNHAIIEISDSGESQITAISLSEAIEKQRGREARILMMDALENTGEIAFNGRTYRLPGGEKKTELTIDDKITWLDSIAKHYNGDVIVLQRSIKEDLMAIKRWNESPALHNVDVEKVLSDLLTEVRVYAPSFSKAIQNAEAALGMIQAFKQCRGERGKLVWEGENLVYYKNRHGDFVAGPMPEKEAFKPSEVEYEEAHDPRSEHDPLLIRPKCIDPAFPKAMVEYVSNFNDITYGWNVTVSSSKILRVMVSFQEQTLTIVGYDLYLFSAEIKRKVVFSGNVPRENGQVDHDFIRKLLLNYQAL